MSLITRRGALAMAAPFLILAVKPAWTASYRQKDLQGADLSHQKLQAQDFTGANLSNANLSFTDFSKSLFKRATFKDNNFSGAWFTDADLSEAMLQYADLSGAHLRNAKFRDANLSGAKIVLAGAVLPEDDADEEIVRLRRNIAETARSAGAFSDRDSGSLSFNNANLRNALILGNLEGVDFRRADLRGADLSHATNTNNGMFARAMYDDDTVWKNKQPEKGAVLTK